MPLTIGTRVYITFDAPRFSNTGTITKLGRSYVYVKVDARGPYRGGVLKFAAASLSAI